MVSVGESMMRSFIIDVGGVVNSCFAMLCYAMMMEIQMVNRGYSMWWRKGGVAYKYGVGERCILGV